MFDNVDSSKNNLSNKDFVIPAYSHKGIEKDRTYENVTIEQPTESLNHLNQMQHLIEELY